MKTLASIIAISLAACSGGGSLSSPISPAVVSPPKSPVLVPSKLAMVPTTITFSIPATSESTVKTMNVTPKYISYGTQSLNVNITDSTGAVTSTNIDLTRTSGGCTTGLGLTTCVETINAPIGADTFVLTMYSSTGGALGIGQKLSTGTISATIVAGVANALNVRMLGIVAAIGLSYPGRVLINGNHGSKVITTTVIAFDATDHVISGSDAYATPITVSQTGDPTHFTLSTTTFNSPASSALGISYDGTYPTLPNPNILSFASGSVSATLSVFISVPPLPTSSLNPVSFTSIGQSFTSPISELDYSGVWTFTDTCAGIATITNNGTSFTGVSQAVGKCAVTVADSFGNQTVVPVSVTVTGFTVN